MPDRTLLIRHIPEDLHRDFKALCAREGVTMGWKVRELIETAIIMSIPALVKAEKGE